MLHVVTPVIESAVLSQLVGARVLLKLDNAQASGSFKIRGIGLLCQKLVASGTKHLVSSSGGNAGMAVAYAGRKLGVKVTVVVPETTSVFMRKKIATEGAEVVVHGKCLDDAHQEALRLARELGTEVVHPFDHPLLWEGHSTIIEELKEQLPEPPTHIITVAGGGGLLAGLLLGLERANWKDVKVLISETEGAHSFNTALNEGRIVTLPAITSLATTLGARTVGEEPFRRASSWGVKSFVVSDQQALDAVKSFQADHQALVELSCGAGLALLYSPSSRSQLGSFSSSDTILIFICGGNAVSIELIQHWEKILAEKLKQ